MKKKSLRNWHVPGGGLLTRRWSWEPTIIMIYNRSVRAAKPQTRVFVQSQHFYEAITRIEF